MITTQTYGGYASLSEAFEVACAIAADLYSKGLDTTKADAEVERLLALLEAK